MKRMISYLAVVTAIGLAIATFAQPDGVSARAEASAAVEPVAASTPCIECDYAFGACMSECWDTGGGPPCKNDCLRERDACRATCE